MTRPTPTAMQGLRALVLSPDPAALRALTWSLQARFFSVCTAADGDRGLDLLLSALLSLAGHRLAAEWGSAGDAQSRTLQRKLGGNLTLVLRESSDAALQAVLNGEADAATVDAVSLALFTAGKDRLAAVGEPLQSEPYVIVVPAHAPKLLAAINAALADMSADGSLAAIKARWLPGTPVE